MIPLIPALIILFIIGAGFGSFACCQAWRLRLKATGKKSPGRRSVCMHCHKQLKWYENIPILSWLFLRGKCRYCKKPIGKAEIFAEVGLGLAFAGVSYPYFANYLPDGSLTFALTTVAYFVLLALLVVLGILAVYDGKWGELPLFLLIMAIIGGAIIAILLMGVKLIAYTNIGDILLNLLGSVVIFAGPCFLIYKLSKEKLMGGGDWLLALALALVLGDWWLALWALFLSNLIGSIVMLPSTIKTKNHKVYFGPFLVIGFVLVVTFSQFISSMMIMY